MLEGPEWVMTAAHCMQAVIYAYVTLGTNYPFEIFDPEGLEIRSDRHVNHPEFDFPSYDISLLHLETPVPIGMKITRPWGISLIKT